MPSADPPGAWTDTVARLDKYTAADLFSKARHELQKAMRQGSISRGRVRLEKKPHPAHQPHASAPHDNPCDSVGMAEGWSRVEDSDQVNSFIFIYRVRAVPASEAKAESGKVEVATWNGERQEVAVVFDKDTYRHLVEWGLKKKLSRVSLRKRKKGEGETADYQPVADTSEYVAVGEEFLLLDILGGSATPSQAICIACATIQMSSSSPLKWTIGCPHPRRRFSRLTPSPTCRD